MARYCRRELPGSADHHDLSDAGKKMTPPKESPRIPGLDNCGTSGCMDKAMKGKAYCAYHLQAFTPPPPKESTGLDKPEEGLARVVSARRAGAYEVEFMGKRLASSPPWIYPHAAIFADGLNEAVKPLREKAEGLEKENRKLESELIGAAMRDAHPGPITFYDGDNGVERVIVFEAGEPEVGISDGWMTEDDYRPIRETLYWRMKQVIDALHVARKSLKKDRDAWKEKFELEVTKAAWINEAAKANRQDADRLAEVAIKLYSGSTAKTCSDGLAIEYHKVIAAHEKLVGGSKKEG